MGENDLSNKQILDTLLNAIKEEGKANKEELKREIKEETQILLQKLEKNTSNIDKLTQQYIALENRYINFERIIRKNNIIIFGLNVPTGTNLLHFTLNKLQHLLGVQLQETDINNVYQLKSDGTPPIKVEFVTFLKKDLIIKNCRKLKGTKIFISQDLCPEDRKDQKVLNDHLKIARSKNYLAKIKGKKLEINGESYTIEQLRQTEIEKPTPRTYEENLSPVTSRRSHSAPQTPSIIEIDASVPSGSQINATEVTNENDLAIGNYENKKPEKRENPSPADRAKEKEKKKTQRTNSASSVKSDKSERQLRQIRK